jgi:phosphatidylglycerophosphatase A
MDETCGMMLSLVWLPREVSIYIGAFILFRLLDIIKPWPICLIQQSKRPTSIVWDDLAAGVATNAILQVFVRVF